jgi:hypothetical protein
MDAQYLGRYEEYGDKTKVKWIAADVIRRQGLDIDFQFKPHSKEDQSTEVECFNGIPKSPTL